MPLRWTWILTRLVMLGCILTGGPAAAAEEPALAGHWQLDPERSDSVERASRDALRDLRRILQPRGNAPRPGAAAVDQRAQQVLAPLSPPLQRVSIEFDEAEAVFHFDGQPARSYHTDGRAAVIDSQRPEQSIAAWEAGSLYVERTFDAGMRIIEAWSLEGEQLRVDYEARNSLFDEPIRFTLRFDRVAGPP